MLVLLGLICLFEDTPLSLLKTKNVQKICASLNRIGRINKGEDNLVSEAEIEEYLQQEEERERVKESAAVLDMCRYRSLRIPSLVLCGFAFLMSIVYFSHSSIIAAIGFNPTLNQFLMNISELACLPLILFVFSSCARKVNLLLFVFLGTAFSLTSVFVKVPANCENCVAVLVQVGLAMLTRSCIPKQQTKLYVPATNLLMLAG